MLSLEIRKQNRKQHDQDVKMAEWLIHISEVQQEIKAEMVRLDLKLERITGRLEGFVCRQAMERGVAAK